MFLQGVPQDLLLLKLVTTKVFLNAENLYTPKSPPISIENL